jgi:hypothetical protein
MSRTYAVMFVITVDDPPASDARELRMSGPEADLPQALDLLWHGHLQDVAVRSIAWPQRALDVAALPVLRGSVHGVDGHRVLVAPEARERPPCGGAR